MKTPNINKILRANPVNSRRGAPMGASSYTDTTIKHKCHLQRVNFIDGDYAPDGTYWGNSSKAGALWCAFNGIVPNHCNGVADITRVYVRAHSRLLAMCEVVKAFPSVQFIRG